MLCFQNTVSLECVCSTLHERSAFICRIGTLGAKHLRLWRSAIPVAASKLRNHGILGWAGKMPCSMGLVVWAIICPGCEEQYGVNI